MNKFEAIRKVYIHDTDFTGAVYYSRYLEWMEEVRVNFLDCEYKTVELMAKEDGVGFMVTKCDLRYLRVLKFGEMVKIVCNARVAGLTRIGLDYRIYGKDEIKARGSVELVCMSIERGIPTRVPSGLVELIT